MEATKKFSNFSIDDILGSGFGPSSPPLEPVIHTVGLGLGDLPGGCFHGFSAHHPRSLDCLDYSTVGRVWVPRPPAVLLPARGTYHGMDFGFGADSYPTSRAHGLHYAAFSLYPNAVHSTVHRPTGFHMDTGRQPLSSLENSSSQQQPRPATTGRMRTVFTDSQSKHLDKLFEVTDYPGVETRAQLARSAGLTEETVRVWFKNRRARSKKKHCSRVDPSPYSRPLLRQSPRPLDCTEIHG